MIIMDSEKHGKKKLIPHSVFGFLVGTTIHDKNDLMFFRSTISSIEKF